MKGFPITCCPRCGHALERRRRSLPDRLRSVFADKARYRCAARCGFEALLPRIPRDPGRSRYLLAAPQLAPQRLTPRLGSR